MCVCDTNRFIFIYGNAVWVEKCTSNLSRLMNRVVGNMSGYADNIAVYLNMWGEHLDHIREFFSHLSEANLTVNLAKC